MPLLSGPTCDVTVVVLVLVIALDKKAVVNKWKTILETCLADKTWKKEEELKGLKAELAALDRKIQLELAPPQEQDTAEKHETKNIETEQSIVGKQARSVCRL